MIIKLTTDEHAGTSDSVQLKKSTMHPDGALELNPTKVTKVLSENGELKEEKMYL